MTEGVVIPKGSRLDDLIKYATAAGIAGLIVGGVTSPEVLDTLPVIKEAAISISDVEGSEVFSRWWNSSMLGVLSTYAGAGAYVAKTYSRALVDSVTGMYEHNKEVLKEAVYWTAKKSLDLIDSGKNLQNAIKYRDGDEGLTGLAKSGARGFGLGMAAGAFFPEGAPEKEALLFLGMQLDVQQYCFRSLFGMGYHWYVKPGIKFLRNSMKRNKK